MPKHSHSPCTPPPPPSATAPSPPSRTSSPTRRMRKAAKQRCEAELVSGHEGEKDLPSSRSPTHLCRYITPAIPASFFIYCTNLINFGAMALLETSTPSSYFGCHRLLHDLCRRPRFLSRCCRLQLPPDSTHSPLQWWSPFFWHSGEKLCVVNAAKMRIISRTTIVWNATSKITITCPIITKCNACDVWMMNIIRKHFHRSC